MIRRGAAIAAIALLLAGCSSTADDPRLRSAQQAPEAEELIELRQSLGLPDCPETDPSAEAVESGLPRTQLRCLGSEEVVNLAGLPREPMVVNLWAQWCEPCREEAPYLEAAHAARDDVAFYGIDYDDPKPDWAIELAAEFGWDYPHIQDADAELRGPLGVPGIPMTLFVDADGVIQYRHAGVLESEAQLEALMEEHL